MDFERPLAVVTPTLDGDVLAVLASADIAITGREVQRRIGASQEGVRRALDRLTRQGVVLRHRAGNAHLYRLNRDHLAATWIEGLSTLRLQLIDRLRQTIERWDVGPVLAVLFGSAARGEAGRESDLDILVVRPLGHDPDDAVWRAQLNALEADAFAWTGNDARVLEYGEEELQRSEEDPLLRSAASEGVVLFGSATVLPRAQRTGKA